MSDVGAQASILGAATLGKLPMESRRHSQPRTSERTHGYPESDLAAGCKGGPPTHRSEAVLQTASICEIQRRLGHMGAGRGDE